jgi:hypothetical protein
MNGGAVFLREACPEEVVFDLRPGSQEGDSYLLKASWDNKHLRAECKLSRNKFTKPSREYLEEGLLSNPFRHT